MSRVDLDKLRSIRMGGRTRGLSRVRELHDEGSGRVTGFEIDHGDTQAAVVRPGVIKAEISVSTGKVKVDG